MAIAFPRSIRALGNDRFRPSNVTLLISILFLLVWFGWFFLVPIPTYEASTNFKLGRNGSVAVTFPASALSRVQAGQPAILELNAPDQTKTTYQGEVLRKPAAAENTASTLELYFPDFAQAPANAQGTVRVEIESTTPAALLLQAVRQSSGALNPTSSSPTPTSSP
jgi:hypothetical protein